MRNLVLIIITLGLTISLRAVSYPPDGWRMPMSIIEASGAQKYPEAYAQGDTVHIVWYDDHKLYYKKSTDFGFTWSTPLIISIDGEVVVDAKSNIGIAGVNDELFVSYAVDEGEPYFTYAIAVIRSTDGGANWQDHQSVDKELLSIPEPSINANPDSVRIVYRRDKNNWCGVAYTASDLDLSEWSNDEIGEGNVYTPHLIMAGGYPHVIFINYDPNYIISVLCHATVMAIPSDWAVTNILVDPNNRYNYSRIAVDPQGWLHVLWEEMTSGYIRVAHSTDGGSHWSGFNFIAYSNSSGSSLATSSQGILVVFDSLDNGVRHVYGRASNDFGVSWNNPFQITDFSGINESNCYLVSGHSARHLLFQRQDPTSDYDLYYMAYDDSLLSDSPEATAYNSASHLARDYFSGSLHLVYQSQDRLLYSYSNDGGMTWTPHHILEDPETQQKEHGRYPSIGLNPGFFACNPCVVFVDSDNQVKYLYRDLGGEWQGFTILPAIFGLDPGPPAIATYGGDVYVVFSVMSWVGREDFISAVLFYQFSSSATEPPDPTILDQAMNGSLYGSNVSITIDGNGAPHVAWSKKVGLNNYEDIFYCWRDANGNWQQIRNISEQSNAQSVCPHIDDYGDYLSAVWWYDGDYEIWLRQKYIPDDWEDKIPYSQEYAICNYPVNAAVDFSVWCETPSNQSDIRYHSNSYNWGWVSQASKNEYFCHSQLQRDWSPWDLYTIFTKGNEIPYRIVSVHQQFGDAPPRTESPLYTVETGQDSASAFCLQRDGTIRYGNCSVDYANNELIYDLCFLEGLFPFHKIKGTAYFEGNGNKTHEIWINGHKKIALVVKSKQAYNFEILVPRELYQTGHRVTVSIKNPQANGVYLSGLKVYRSIDGKAGNGGPQSAGSGALESWCHLIVTPNPFSNNLKIRLQIPEQSNEKAGIKIYDTAGRLIKSFRQSTSTEHNKSELSWDGCDDNGRQLPGGIYFIELKSGNQSKTEKVIKLR